MKADQQLDISRELIPVSLALCKSVLARMGAGSVLEIRLCDRDTLQDLQMARLTGVTSPQISSC